MALPLPRATSALRTALVTGACSGIGRALATRLGSLGFDLVLVSNRAEPLGETAAAIRREHGVTTHAIPMDLARPDAAAELHAAVRALGLDVDVLVLNAGIFFFGEVADASPERANTLLQLHVVTPSLLATLFGKELRARRRGHVLFVSSISAWRVLPGIAYYGASKAYLLGFAQALRSEIAPYGVNVTCLLPGATATALYDPNVVPVDLAMRLGMMMRPEQVAEEGLRAMFAGEAEIIPGRLTRLMTAGATHAPRWAVDLLRRRNPWLPVKDG